MDLSKLKLLHIEYFKNETAYVAKDLIGKIFVKTETNGNILAGKIVETEAYIPSGDLANHSARGKTARNAPMHEAGGILYVYMIYGIHHCVNIVTGKENEGAAVLIRALEPVEGIDIMKQRRNTDKLSNLCSGPGKIAQAFAMTRDDNFKILGESEYAVYNSQKVKESEIETTTRIGIKESKDLPLRFYLKGSVHVSVK